MKLEIQIILDTIYNNIEYTCSGLNSDTTNKRSGTAYFIFYFLE